MSRTILSSAILLACLLASPAEAFKCVEYTEGTWVRDDETSGYRPYLTLRECHRKEPRVFACSSILRNQPGCLAYDEALALALQKDRDEDNPPSRRDETPAPRPGNISTSAPAPRASPQPSPPPIAPPPQRMICANGWCGPDVADKAKRPPGSLEYATDACNRIQQGSNKRFYESVGGTLAKCRGFYAQALGHIPQPGQFAEIDRAVQKAASAERGQTQGTKCPRGSESAVYCEPPQENYEIYDIYRTNTGVAPMDVKVVPDVQRYNYRPRWVSVPANGKRHLVYNNYGPVKVTEIACPDAHGPAY